MLKTERRLEDRASRHLLSCKRNCQHLNLCCNMEYIMMFPERSLKLVKLSWEIPFLNHQHISGTEQFGVRKIRIIPSGMNGPSINGRIYYEANCHDIQWNLFYTCHRNKEKGSKFHAKFDTFRPERNARYFTDNVFTCICRMKLLHTKFIIVLFLFWLSGFFEFIYWHLDILRSSQGHCMFTGYYTWWLGNKTLSNTLRSQLNLRHLLCILIQI